ncbi:MAG: hypothetical protein IKH57_21300 [Clostridia bacterium]|nr:hypothetical protein [Clostridia bacterium]
MTQEEIISFVNHKIQAYGCPKTAMEAGVSETIIHKWKYNKCGPRLDTLIRLLDVWGYEIIIRRKGE